ncbi:hypothetical protein [Streptomyces rochei]|uniref:hypothetical protein n=1 Tax=Streptomyces rochei TaxID=1928 RepID=UPI0033B6BC95
MSSSDEILEQIDAAVHDWTVSGDAMRCRPAPEPDPVPAVPVVPVVPDSGRAAARAVLVSRLVDRGLEPAEAAAAVRAAETGQPTEHLELLSAEARAAAAEAGQRVGQLLVAFVRALQPVVQAAAAVLRQLDEALRTAGHTASSGKLDRRDRPAWQSPYGPPPRRKR